MVTTPASDPSQSRPFSYGRLPVKKPWVLGPRLAKFAASLLVLPFILLPFFFFYAMFFSSNTVLLTDLEAPLADYWFPISSLGGLIYAIVYARASAKKWYKKIPKSIGIWFIAFSILMFYTIIVLASINEYVFFERYGTSVTAETYRILNADTHNGRRSRGYYAKFNPLHIRSTPQVRVDQPAYDYLMRERKLAPDHSAYKSWQSEYYTTDVCLQLTVQRAGKHARVLLPRHKKFSIPDFIPCPAGMK